MIEESYCSVEIALLLRKKVFPLKQLTHLLQKNNADGTSEIVSTCTHQLAMRWLREVHNIFIYIIPMGNGIYFSAHILYNGIDKVIGGITFGIYEEAVEASLKYCLKKLI